MTTPPVRRSGPPLARAWSTVASAFDRFLLRSIARATPSEQNRLLGLTIAVGAACGLSAVAFHLFIRVVEAAVLGRVLLASGWHQALGLVVVPALGALVAGAILDRYAPAARGSGIPQVKWVYAARAGRLRSRDAIAKFVLAALQIGTGSSLGREGPTVQICATVAGSLGRLFALSPGNQRRLIPVGAAAGIAAAFNAPIAAITFVIEELVGGLDNTVLSGVVIAAAVSAAVEHSILGERPVLAVPAAYGLTHASSLVVFAVLGLFAGFSGHGFCAGLLRVRGRFRSQTSVPTWAQPAVGGLFTGVISMIALRLVHTAGIAGGGYETLNRALMGGLPVKVLAVLCIAKFVATISSYSSGGAGGIFAPVLFVGAMLGGLFGEVDRLVLVHPDTQLGAFALVGMGAFFAAVVRAPMTSILIVFEMTGSYRLVLPLMVATTMAYVTSKAWSPTPIYDALLEQDGLRLPQHELASPVLATHHVEDALVRDVTSLSADDTVEAALVAVEALPFDVFPVVGPESSLRGMITESRLRRILADGRGHETVGAHAGRRDALKPRQNLRDALGTMNTLGVRVMPVVSETEPERLIGLIAMSDVVRVLLRLETGGEGPTASG